MSNTLEELQFDHRNIARLLSLLEAQIESMHGVDEADYGLMQEIMLYMTSYPDITHHPKEDLMFERLEARDERAHAPIADLVKEHKELGFKGMALRDIVDRAVEGDALARKEVESRGRHYIELLRRHMEKENKEVFPLAEQSLNEEDWEHIAAAFAAHEDPLFGSVVQGDYGTLAKSIQGEIE